MIRILEKLRVFHTIGFIIICLSIGQLITILLTSLVFDVSLVQLTEILKDPANIAKSLIISLSIFYSLFSFLIIPVIYLFFSRNSSYSFLLKNNKTKFTPLLMSIMMVFTIVPFVAMLIKLNQGVEFPIWLSDLENYFKESERNARQLTSPLLSFGESKDLVIALIIMAVIPGIVEEIFFRGMVQTQFQSVLKNYHFAILFAAFLFSFFHFQFYGFLPRMVLGVLFGYIYAWSNNIWYPCAAHIANNSIAVVGGYFSGPQFLATENDSFISSTALIIPSIIITGFIILYLKRTKNVGKLKVNEPANS